jgi:hypothetical protein
VDGGVSYASGRELREPEDRCAFILESGESCGAGLRTGSSYCDHHHALCHLPSGGVRERRRVREAEALAAAVGGRLGRPTRLPPDPLLRRLENVARGFSSAKCSRFVPRGEE